MCGLHWRNESSFPNSGFFGRICISYHGCDGARFVVSLLSGFQEMLCLILLLQMKFFFLQNKFLALHQSCEGEAQFHMMLTASDD